MIALAWSFFMVLSMVLASSQAFLTAPVPGYSHGLTTYESTSISDTEDSHEVEDEHEDYARNNLRIEFETEADGKGESHRNRGSKDMSDDGSEGQSPLDPWSIVWYIGSFGGLVAFFLIVSCSEWCCRRGARPLSVPYTQRGEVISTQPATESPPPPYHLFAPPPYDSVNYADYADKSVPAEKLDIYVITVPIHQGPQQQQQHQPPPA